MPQKSFPRHLFICILESFKILSAMVADRADEIGRKFLPFVNVVANRARPSFFLFFFWSRFRLYIVKVVAVTHAFCCRADKAFGYIRQENRMRIAIDGLEDLSAHDRIYEFRQIQQTVFGAVFRIAGIKFLFVSSALHAEMFEHKERCIF